MHKIVTVNTVARSMKKSDAKCNTPGNVQKEEKNCNYLKSITMSVHESDWFRLLGITVQFPHLLLTILVYTLRRKNPSKLSSEPQNGMETMSSAVHWNPPQLLQSWEEHYENGHAEQWMHRHHHHHWAQTISNTRIQCASGSKDCWPRGCIHHCTPLTATTVPGGCEGNRRKACTGYMSFGKPRGRTKKKKGCTRISKFCRLGKDRIHILMFCTQGKDRKTRGTSKSCTPETDRTRIARSCTRNRRRKGRLLLWAKKAKTRSSMGCPSTGVSPSSPSSQLSALSTDPRIPWPPHAAFASRQSHAAHLEAPACSHAPSPRTWCSTWGLWAPPPTPGGRSRTHAQNQSRKTWFWTSNFLASFKPEQHTTTFDRSKPATPTFDLFQIRLQPPP